MRKIFPINSLKGFFFHYFLKINEKSKDLFSISPKITFIAFSPQLILVFQLLKFFETLMLQPPFWNIFPVYIINVFG